MTTLYWHDYETFGTNPAQDRPVQFAGVRTDEDLNIVSEPFSIYCRPSNDMLPQPEACLVTGITPQQAFEKGVNEAEFITAIHNEIASPNTCTVGYNNIRFDDEVTRYTLYRNFYDPYAREWQNGNSRWDIIDMVRMCYALRPEGINWPQYEDGRPTFKLEELSKANDIIHESAHDAVSDVIATIEFAKLIKNKQPRLYEFLYKLRNKHEAASYLSLANKTPIVHTSGMFSSEYGCTSIVVPVAAHPTNRNSIIVYDLRYDPEALLKLSAEEIQQRVFTKVDELPEGQERIHLKAIQINKCPALAPLNTLSAEAEQRIQLTQTLAMQHYDKLDQANDLHKTIETVFNSTPFESPTDPEQNLYGGFLSSEDKARCEQIRTSSANALIDLSLPFEDKRLPELLFRYRARNFPETLNDDELQRWEEHRIARITQAGAGGSITLEEFENKLMELGTDPDLNEQQLTILEELAEYATWLIN